MHKLPPRLLGQLLRPVPLPQNITSLASSSLPSALQTALRNAFNNSQLAAIAAAIFGRNPFTLVQVMPGACAHAYLVTSIRPWSLLGFLYPCCTRSIICLHVTGAGSLSLGFSTDMALLQHIDFTP